MFVENEEDISGIFFSEVHTLRQKILGVSEPWLGYKMPSKFFLVYQNHGSGTKCPKDSLVYQNHGSGTIPPINIFLGRWLFPSADLPTYLETPPAYSGDRLKHLC